MPVDSFTGSKKSVDSIHLLTSKSFDIIGSKEINKNHIPFPEVVHTVFHQVVASQTFLKVNAFLLFQSKISDGLDMKLLFAETNSISHSMSELSLFVHILKVASLLITHFYLILSKKINRIQIKRK